MFCQLNMRIQVSSEHYCW